jgi:uncharacterized protein (TIGR03643 family)
MRNNWVNNSYLFSCFLRDKKLAPFGFTAGGLFCCHLRLASLRLSPACIYYRPAFITGLLSGRLAGRCRCHYLIVREPIYRPRGVTPVPKVSTLSDEEISEIIEMALSDHTSFAQIEALYGLRDKDVKALMRRNLKRGSYEAWRRRVRAFSDRRATYK